MKIAIVQNSFIMGGRLRFLASFIAYLNRINIRPDVISYSMDFDADFIRESFDIDIDFSKRILDRPFHALSQELSIFCFNRQVRKLICEYDCVINSSNSWIGLPKYDNVIHYIHFPRKYRLWNDIHSEGEGESAAPLHERLHRAAMKLLYQTKDNKPPKHILANSAFTAKAINSLWDSAQPKVIYPPISGEFSAPAFSEWRSREAGKFVVLGRFSPIKGQFKLIQKIGDFPASFHFIGFADIDSDYYRSCENAASKQDNVYLYPNASIKQMREVLATSRYYLHTTINEPFGLSIVDALGSGLLPVIHASGGAVEIVPYPLLQYEEFSLLGSSLEALMGQDATDQYALLVELVGRCNECFGADSFAAGWESELRHFGVSIQR